MKKTIVSIFLALCIYYIDTPLVAAPIQSYCPNLYVSQTWDIEVLKDTEPKAVSVKTNAVFIPKQIPYVYRFFVEDIIKIDKQECYRIRIKCISVDGRNVSEERMVKIFIRTDDYTLLAVQRLSVNGQIYAQRKFPVGPVNATGWAGFLPMYFPSLQDSYRQYKPKTVRVSANKGVFITASNLMEQNCVEIIESSKMITNKYLQVEMKSPNNNNSQFWHIKQKWKQGYPWWSETTCKYNGKIWCTAKLLYNSITNNVEDSLIRDE